MTDRRCVACWQVKNRDELIKVTSCSADGTLVIKPDSLIFGRSAYLCYNESCIEAAFKKNKLGKVLKRQIPDELKGQLLNELRNS